MNGRSMISVEESYSRAETVTRAAARNFFYTFRFLPPERRRSIFAVYAFSRRADDAVDAVEEQNLDEAEARRRLDQLEALLTSGDVDDPLAPALKDTIERFQIPLEPFRELLRGMRSDLVKNRYADFDELYEYCYRAASVVGLICIEIFGYRDSRAIEPAVQLGIAMQLTNILRDVREDCERNRVYLPADEMRQFGCDERDLFALNPTQGFQDLMRFQVDRARYFFLEATPLFELVEPESRYCPVLLKRFYSRVLDHIEHRHFDVLTRRPSLSTLEKIVIAGATWIESLATR